MNKRTRNFLVGGLVCIGVCLIGILILSFISFRWWFDVASLDETQRFLLVGLWLIGVVLGIVAVALDERANRGAGQPEKSTELQEPVGGPPDTL